MKYNLNLEKYLKISDNVKEKFEKYRQSLPAKEVGGILLGKVIKNEYIIIETITEPTIYDRSNFFGFIRNKKQAQKNINKYWELSDGEIIYLGEWHTHNENIPTPSFEDKKTMNNLLLTSRLEIDFLFAVIVGIQDNYFGIQTKNGLKKLIKSNNGNFYSL